MLRTLIAGRTVRALATGALILSLTATTLAGSANAAPLAENDCSAAAHARNDAVHLLHKAWKAFSGDLKDLSKDARKLDRESRTSGADLTTDARAEVASAKQELKAIRTQAHSDIQAEVELGSACKDEDDATVATPADSTEDATRFDTSSLDEKYKAIVDQAIADMQAVVDGAREAVTDTTVVAESNDTTDKSKVKKDLEAAKADREKAKEERKDAKADAKNKSNNGKGKGRDRG